MKLFKSTKDKILSNLEKSIQQKDANLLYETLLSAYESGIDSDYNKYIHELLVGTWHEEHEDLVNTIHINKLRNDIFTEPLYKIATLPELYRKDDFETESTLRKCIHALKTIDSEKSRFYIEELRKTQNPNIEFVLDMYK